MFIALITSVCVLSLGDGDAPSDDARAYREQQLAVVEIEKLGGKVLYDYQRPDPKRPNFFDTEAQPAGDGRLHWIVYVNLRGTKTYNAHLKHLRKFPRLENVNLSNTHVTSRGLENFRDAKHLMSLSVANTKVGDAGLEYLKDCKQLWMLVLDGTKVTDEGMLHLGAMTSLEEWLGLSNTRITDKGLKHLKTLTRLRRLNLYRTGVTNAGVEELQKVFVRSEISWGGAWFGE